MDPNMHDDELPPVRFASLDVKVDGTRMLYGAPIDVGVQGYSKLLRPVVDGIAAKFPPEHRAQFFAGVFTGLLSTTVCTIGRAQAVALARDCIRAIEALPDDVVQGCAPKG